MLREVGEARVAAKPRDLRAVRVHAERRTPLRTAVSTAAEFLGEAPTIASERGRAARGHQSRGHSPIASSVDAREAHRDLLARRRRVPARQQRRLRDLSRGVPRRMARASSRRRRRRMGLRARPGGDRLPRELGSRTSGLLPRAGSSGSGLERRAARGDQMLDGWVPPRRKPSSSHAIASWGVAAADRGRAAASAVA